VSSRHGRIMASDASPAVICTATERCDGWGKGAGSEIVRIRPYGLRIARFRWIPSVEADAGRRSAQMPCIGPWSPRPRLHGATGSRA
jgi:hypothetical protein